MWSPMQMDTSRYEKGNYEHSIICTRKHKCSLASSCVVAILKLDHLARMVTCFRQAWCCIGGTSVLWQLIESLSFHIGTVRKMAAP